MAPLALGASALDGSRRYDSDLGRVRAVNLAHQNNPKTTTLFRETLRSFWRRPSLSRKTASTCTTSRR